MRVSICGNTYNESVEKLEELSKQYDNIKEFKKDKNEAYFITYNDDYYRVIPNENSRAVRCDKIYVGRDVNKNFVDWVLTPMICSSNIPQEEQIIYF